MTTSSHIRRIVLTAIVGCAILAGSASAAAARPIDDAFKPNAGAVASAPTQSASSPGERNDRTLPITLAAAVVIAAVGTAGYAYRTRTSRRVIA